MKLFPDMEKLPILIDGYYPGVSPYIIWILVRPKLLTFFKFLDKAYFTCQYLYHLKDLNTESFLNDDVGNRLIRLLVGNKNDKSTHNNLICYNICRILQQDIKKLTDAAYWQIMREHCSSDDWNHFFDDALDIFFNTNVPNNLTKSLGIFRRKLCNRLFRDTDVLLLREAVRNRTIATKMMLKQIYDEIIIFKMCKVSLEGDKTWSNWTQTPFKLWKIGRFCPKNINKIRFIWYHLRFFKNKPLNIILNYEVGAKLMLQMLRDTSLPGFVF